MAAFVLYHTLACHLCDDAEALLKACEIEYSKFDIVEDDDLVNEFGEMIPVLLHMPSNQYIAWPFDGQLITEFVANIEPLNED